MRRSLCELPSRTDARVMTLAPSRDLGWDLEKGYPRLRPAPGETPAPRCARLPFCAVPGCGEAPEPGAHHIEPRSRIGGPLDWVRIDGVLVANLCRLCPQHHRDVTGGIGGYKARIVWRHVGLYCWVWQEKKGNLWKTIGPLAGVP